MSRTLKIGCLLLTVVMILLLPFTLPSGAMLEDEQMRLEEEMWAQEDTGHLIDLLLPKALAEAPATEPLPIDFSPGAGPIPRSLRRMGTRMKASLSTFRHLKKKASCGALRKSI